MTISVERTEIADWELADKIEKLIRECIGERPNEEWKVGIKISRRFCEVSVKGPVQKRSATFYDEGPKLAEKIAAWLNLYPLR
jgi:hypothetical protein